MKLQEKQWNLPDPVPEEVLARLPHVPPLILQLLVNRGITDSDRVDAFLDGEARAENPFQMAGMSQAVTRIRDAIRRGERCVIYGDFDADGVTATALMVQTLNALGARVEPYIPHRVDEGYGLNKDTLTQLAGEGCDLLITVDCGIRAVDEVAYANSLGMDVIITDHHSVGPALPPALAALDPKQPVCRYEFKGLAGVGIAFRLAQALLRSHHQVPIRDDLTVTLDEGDLLDLVAIGTVADLAPLLDENRWLVRRGLERINQAPRPGLQAIMSLAGIAPGQVTSGTIGYVIGPRLNAAGRIDSAMLSYELLSTDDVLRATELALQLDGLNRQRQDLTAAALKEAQEQIEARDSDAYLYMVAEKNFKSGVVGLVAGRLAEAYYRPALVLELGDECSRGSARSIPEFNITKALDRCAEAGLLVRHGGHAAAAGFTVENCNLDAFRAMLQDIAAEELADRDLKPSLVIDKEVLLGDLDWATWGLLQQLEPTGILNPQPLLLSRGLQVRGARQVGSEGAHLKLSVSDPEAGPRSQKIWDAIAFRQGHWFGHLKSRVDLVYSLDENIWNNQRRLQLVVHDLRPDS
ncbi:MAG: single-stranded-DNA-specific exonuclease RecJ [Chloroflexota bacterium]|nr:single-stranded-DNA-specific exonuclease RecJ [Chloroflexota bacterium]